MFFIVKGNMRKLSPDNLINPFMEQPNGDRPLIRPTQVVQLYIGFLVRLLSITLRKHRNRLRDEAPIFIIQRRFCLHRDFPSYIKGRVHQFRRCCRPRSNITNRKCTFVKLVSDRVTGCLNFFDIRVQLQFSQCLADANVEQSGPDKPVKYIVAQLLRQNRRVPYVHISTVLTIPLNPFYEMLPVDPFALKVSENGQ